MWQKNKIIALLQISYQQASSAYRRIYCVTASCVVVKIETNGHESNKIHPPCVMLYRSHRLSQEFVVIA